MRETWIAIWSRNGKPRESRRGGSFDQNRAVVSLRASAARWHAEWPRERELRRIRVDRQVHPVADLRRAGRVDHVGDDPGA